MDADIQAWLDGLSPEERAAVESDARDGMLPVESDGQVDAIVDVRRAREEQGAARDRLTRALSRQDAAEADMWSSVSDRRAVPTQWGPVLQRESPIMQAIKALRAYRTGQRAEEARGDEAYSRERALQGTGAYGRASQGINAEANDAAYRSALRDAMRRWQEERREPVVSPEWIEG